MADELTDDDPMPISSFGKQGKTLGQVPRWYWVWFMMQPWRENHPQLIKYATQQIEKKDD